MKARTLLLLFILVYSGEGQTFDLLAPAAIRSVINEYFAIENCEIDVIKFGGRFGRAEETIEEIYELGNLKASLKLFDDVKENLNRLQLKTSSVLLFDSPENFEEFQGKITWQTSKVKRHRHLVYIHGALLENLETVRRQNFTIDQVGFLINETPQSIELVTAFMFTAEKCRENQFKVINRFGRRDMAWEGSKFFVEKYANFFQCGVQIELVSRSPWQRLLAAAFNYTAVHGTAFDEMAFAFNEFDSDQVDKYHSILSYEANNILIPPGELYSSYEKMLLPFDDGAWIAIAVTIFGSLGFILALKLTPANVQTLIFGRRNSSPFMNFVSILFNGSQSMLLVENSPRIILMVFLFWSLVIRQAILTQKLYSELSSLFFNIHRTCYQSKSFENLQALTRKPLKNTLESLSKANFSIRVSSDKHCEVLDGMFEELKLPK
jgi:hypothetical protein